LNLDLPADTYYVVVSNSYNPLGTSYSVTYLDGTGNPPSVAFPNIRNAAIDPLPWSPGAYFVGFDTGPNDANSFRMNHFPPLLWNGSAFTVYGNQRYHTTSGFETETSISEFNGLPSSTNYSAWFNGISGYDLVTATVTAGGDITFYDGATYTSSPPMSCSPVSPTGNSCGTGAFNLVLTTTAPVSGSLTVSSTTQSGHATNQNYTATWVSAGDGTLAASLSPDGNTTTTTWGGWRTGALIGNYADANAWNGVTTVFAQNRAATGAGSLGVTLTGLVENWGTAATIEIVAEDTQLEIMKSFDNSPSGGQAPFAAVRPANRLSPAR
jgi:hypothetical protein